MSHVEEKKVGSVIQIIQGVYKDTRGIEGANWGERSRGLIKRVTGIYKKVKGR